MTRRNDLPTVFLPTTDDFVHHNAGLSSRATEAGVPTACSPRVGRRKKRWGE